MNDLDIRLMREAIAVARRSRDKGNHPFGAILADEHGDILLEAENTVVTDHDCTGHAEANLMRRATQIYDTEFLASCSIYTSTEPCPMCAAAIFWANVRRVAYGLSEEGLYATIGQDSEEVLRLPCRELYARGRKAMTVVGPILEDEAREVHTGFWQ